MSGTPLGLTVLLSGIPLNGNPEHEVAKSWLLINAIW